MINGNFTVTNTSNQSIKLCNFSGCERLEPLHPTVNDLIQWTWKRFYEEQEEIALCAMASGISIDQMYWKEPEFKWDGSTVTVQGGLLW